MIIPGGLPSLLKIYQLDRACQVEGPILLDRRFVMSVLNHKLVYIFLDDYFLPIFRIFEIHLWIFLSGDFLARTASIVLFLIQVS